MRKILKGIFTAVISFALTLLTVVAGIFPATISVQAEETITYEQTNVMDDLKGSTINGKKFSLTDYNFNAYKETQMISFVEYCYSFYQNMQDNYGLYVYVYNPKGLKFAVNSPLNQIQMAYGLDANQSYVKYSLQFLNCSTEMNYEGLFYKFKVVLMGAQKQELLRNLNSTDRVYRVSGIELMEQGKLNATEYSISTIYHFSGYAAGYGSDPTAGNTLACNSEQGEVLTLNVHPTVYRPEGLNGENEYTQDSLHSVYFAIPNDVIERYGGMTAVHAQWLNAVLAPALVTGNGEVYEAIKPYLGQYMYGGDYYYWKDKDKNNDMPYELIASERMGAVENTELSLPRWAYNANETYQRVGNPTRYINYLYMLFYTGGGTDSADEYTVSSETIMQTLKEGADKYGGYLINGKYSSKMFDSFDTEFTEVNIRADETYELTNTIIDRNWWDRIWGNKGDVTTTTFDNIPAIYAVQESDMSGTPEEICQRLYISEADHTDFKYFYNSNKNVCTTYLFRYQSSDYIAMEAASWETDHGSFWEGDGFIKTYKPNRIDSNNYFFQETVNLDFDIIDVTFSNGSVDTVIPVVSNPIDVIPDATPPVLTISDKEPNWWLIIAAIVLVILVIIFFPQILKFLVKAIVWVATLPFKLIGKLFKKGDKEKKNDETS